MMCAKLFAPTAGSSLLSFTLLLAVHSFANAAEISSAVSTDVSSAVQRRLAPQIVAEVDFSNPNAASNTAYELHNGAQILPNAPAGVSKALRIDSDGPYALIPGVDIGPSAMPECTLTIGLYLESIANNRGWVFGHERSGYDRTILMHDNRFGGGIASAVGKTWRPWNNMNAPPLKEWIHVTAVFRNNGQSYVFLNGVRSDKTVIAGNDAGLSDLWIGRAMHSRHWTDSWIKEVKVFNRALSDDLVREESELFFSTAAPTLAPTSIPTSAPTTPAPTPGAAEFYLKWDGSKAWDVYEGKCEALNRLHIYPFDGNAAQEFVSYPSNEPGFFHIYSTVCPSLRLDLYHNDCSVGNKLIIYDNRENDAQKFQFVTVNGRTVVRPKTCVQAGETLALGMTGESNTHSADGYLGVVDMSVSSGSKYEFDFVDRATAAPTASPTRALTAAPVSAAPVPAVQSVNYGDIINLKNNFMDARWLTGARTNGNDEVFTRDPNSAGHGDPNYEQDRISTYQWTIQMDPSSNGSGCVEYGMPIYLKNNNPTPNSGRWLTGGRTNGNEEVKTFDYVREEGPSYSWTFQRSADDSGTGCVQPYDIVYLKLNSMDGRWLTGARSGGNELVETRDYNNPSNNYYEQSVGATYQWIVQLDNPPTSAPTLAPTVAATPAITASQGNTRTISAQGDPIILGLKGQVFKFDGRDGGWYSNIASKSFNWNMQFKEYPTCKDGSDVFISGMSLLTSKDSNKHQTSESNILIATTPYQIEECRGDDKNCLGDGTLHISFDGGKSYVSNPGDYHYASRNRVVAHNTYGACSRRWYDYNITPKQSRFNRLGGRRVTVEEKKPFELLMEKAEAMINPDECLQWIEERKSKDDLFDQKGLWSTMHVQTPSVSFHIEYRQSNPEKSDKECDFQSLDAWMVTVSKDLEEESWEGILGETKEKIYDETGHQVMTDRDVLLRGKNDVDYEVDGPFGTTFNAQQKKMSILQW